MTDQERMGQRASRTTSLQYRFFVCALYRGAETDVPSSMSGVCVPSGAMRTIRSGCVSPVRTV